MPSVSVSRFFFWRAMKAMKHIQFSRAGKRRFNSRVQSLLSLLAWNEGLFLREWHKLVQGWLSEVHRRAKIWREGAEFHNTQSTEGIIDEGRLHVFGVLDIAE